MAKLLLLLAGSLLFACQPARVAQYDYASTWTVGAHTYMARAVSRSVQIECWPGIFFEATVLNDALENRRTGAPYIWMSAGLRGLKDTGRTERYRIVSARGPAFIAQDGEAYFIAFIPDGNGKHKGYFSTGEGNYYLTLTSQGDGRYIVILPSAPASDDDGVPTSISARLKGTGRHH